MAISFQEKIESYLKDREQITQEQEDAIRSPSRLTIVRACPGSGKTRMFAARTAFEIANWKEAGKGVAALSFTNVAKREVVARMSALGMAVDFPHFVGTIDAFLLRYVVRRFGQHILNGSWFTNPIGETVHKGAQSVKYAYGTEPMAQSQLANFRIEIFGGKPHVYVKRQFDSEMYEVASQFAENIKRAKTEAWKKYGEATYADICYLAYWILKDEQIANLAASRFPSILIDEFQDTGGLRELCIKALVRSQKFRRGFFVGDPDQCIMDFAGANVGLFGSFEGFDGAKSFSLTKCFRAHKSITEVAICFQRENVAFMAQRPRDKNASVIIATHKFGPKQQDLSDVAHAFERFIGDEQTTVEDAAILTWRGSDVAKLSGTHPKSCPLESTSLKSIYDGLVQYYGGESLKLYAQVEQVLATILFESPSPTDKRLATIGLTRQLWKKTVWKISTWDCIPMNDEVTVEDWVQSVRAGFEREVSKLVTSKKSLGKDFRKKVAKNEDELKVFSTPLKYYVRIRNETLDSQRFSIERIHRVKGREFDSVCLFVPTPSRNSVSGLTLWFGYLDNQMNQIMEAEDSGSARRVAYVAITRVHSFLL